MEGAWFLSGHKLQSLSEGQLIDCSGQNCGGGNPGHAIDYVVKNHGIDSERDYKYVPKNGKCDTRRAGRHAAAMAASRGVPQKNERQLLAAVSRQPVAVAIDAVHGGFRGYHRGVLGGKCGVKIDHSVLVVGFGDEILPAPPPPGPRTVCSTQPLAGSERCFNISGLPRGHMLLPKAAKCRGSGCYIWSWSTCAAACHELNQTVAALSSDSKGNDHCSCGAATDLATPAALARDRPLAECIGGTAVRNCSVSTSGCLCRNVGTEKAHCAHHCDESCGSTSRALTFSFNCTVVVPPPTPPPPPRVIPYWIVKNSWGGGYGDHGYIRMQRGVGSAGLCCINCMPQYAIGRKGPAPAPPVPPAPASPRCNVSNAGRACFNVTGLREPLLPRLGGRDSDRLSLESCGTACGWSWHWDGSWVAANMSWAGPGWTRTRTNATVAAVEQASTATKHKAATDRCLCGTVADLVAPAAKGRAVPMQVCLATNCTGDKAEPCGALGRMLVYGFAC